MDLIGDIIILLISDRLRYKMGNIYYVVFCIHRVKAHIVSVGQDGPHACGARRSLYMSYPTRTWSQSLNISNVLHMTNYV